MASGAAKTGKNLVGAVEAVPLLVADVFHLAGLFRRQGEEIARLAGRTQADWQTLSAIADGPRTVPQIARRLGLARQSVQRTTDRLEVESLVRFVGNPDHKKSTLVELTAAGRNALDTINGAARAFHRDVATRVGAGALVQAELLLRRLCDTLDPRSR
jgi:DNA-binding MarR family transcriptional regulator